MGLEVVGSSPTGPTSSDGGLTRSRSPETMTSAFPVTAASRTKLSAGSARTAVTCSSGMTTCSGYEATLGRLAEAGAP